MKKPYLLSLFVLLVACASAEPPQGGSTGLTFVHLNDTYRVGAVEDGKAGGFSRVVSVIRGLKAEGKDVRVLHGGDFLYPSLESGLWDGEQMVDAFNFMDAIAPMYVVAGNHEFDSRSSDPLVAAVKASQFDWLGDNYRFASGDDAVDEALKSAFTFESNGKTIGIFAISIHPDDGGGDRAYAPMQKDYLGVAKTVIQKLENAGVDAIIGLTHLHMWQDTDLARLRAEHPKFVFIVGGHEHEPELQELTPTSAAVMKGASNARTIWAIDLDFDANGKPTIATKMIDLNESVALDADYEVLATKWRTRLVETFPFIEARIGEAAVALDGREVTVRNAESNWGTFIADQMRGAFGKPHADLAFINGGTLRIDDIIHGEILFEHIGRTFAYSSYLRQTTVSGAEFRQVMEAGYRGFGASKGYFPQVSGFRVCVDRSRNEGDRIVSLQVPDDKVGWQEIIADKTYSLIVPDFLYGGGDGYKIPKDRPASRPASELVYRVLDAVINATAEGRKVGAAVDPDNPRYHELHEGKEPCFGH
jgi:2',3'-cyclic-nucleotide 2'-phosphodiesterase (5'-nucleotidase family)